MRLSLSLSYTLSYILLHATYSHAIKFKVEGRHWSSDNTLSRRGNVDGSSPLKNDADISYYANVTLNGQSFSALIDTGSGDLWVAGTVPNSKDTGKKATVNYAVGKVQGPIKTAEVLFAGFKVPNQAYLEVPVDDSNKKGTGLIGLGPHDNSNIYNTIKSNDGVPLLDTIFMQNTSTPNYLTVNLGRLEDPTDIFSGDISIGEILPTPDSFASQQINLNDVTSQPKLPVNIVPVRKKSDQHFQILLDENGIIGPDNQSIPFTTTVSGAKNTKQAVAIVDTGFSLTQVPKAVADAFYGRHPGAEFTNVTGVGPTWTVPCNQEVNLTFVIGGHRFPMHPLDAALNPKILNLATLKNSQGESSCIGMFQPFTFDVGKDPTYDIILGMSFSKGFPSPPSRPHTAYADLPHSVVRNAYILFDFGDFTAKANGNNTKRGDPYLQMLSTINPAASHSDFVTVRLDGVDTTDQQSLDPNRARKSNDKGKKGKNTALYLGLAIGAGVLGLVAFVTALILYRRRRAAAARGARSTGGMFGVGGAGAYSKLQDDHHIDMQHTTYTGQPGTGQLYGNGGMGGFQAESLYDPARPNPSAGNEYPNPWDTRR
ncbi:hypothetical protein V5O48_018245 [Marasmius crinis-equi]|uniref:Peptidase A1 domain-containing protein n=1 Tax=Marasmius crinis-equi TaxID=585013 RepID=A0ABR3ELQ1_9AGAR